MPHVGSTLVEKARCGRVLNCDEHGEATSKHPSLGTGTDPAPETKRGVCLRTGGLRDYQAFALRGLRNKATKHRQGPEQCSGGQLKPRTQK